jgi:O-antigen/teichoic acid export membrane protein
LNVGTTTLISTRDGTPERLEAGPTAAGRVVDPRRTALVLGAGQLAYRSCLAVYTVVVARRLATADFGDFATAFAVATILVMVADGGFTRLLVRDVARANGSDLVLIRTLLTVRAMWAVLVAMAATAAALAGVVLALVGGLVGFLSGTGPIRSAARMVGLAAVAAGVTYLVGRAFGATIT